MSLCGAGLLWLGCAIIFAVVFGVVAYRMQKDDALDDYRELKAFYTDCRRQVNELTKENLDLRREHEL